MATVHVQHARKLASHEFVPTNVSRNPRSMYFQRKKLASLAGMPHAVLACVEHSNFILFCFRRKKRVREGFTISGQSHISFKQKCDASRPSCGTCLTSRHLGETCAYEEVEKGFPQIDSAHSLQDMTTRNPDSSGVTKPLSEALPDVSLLRYTSQLHSFRLEPAAFHAPAFESVRIPIIRSLPLPLYDTYDPYAFALSDISSGDNNLKL